MENTKVRVKVPIGVKLITMTATLLITATFAVVFLATKIFSDDYTAFIQLSNSQISGKLASQTYSYLGHLVNVVTTMTEIPQKDLDQHFARNDEVVGIMVWRKGSNKPDRDQFRDGKMEYSKYYQMLKAAPAVWDDGNNVDIRRVNIGGDGLLLLSFPLMVDQNKKVMTAAAALVSQNKFVQMYGKKEAVTSYLVDHEGNVLAHPNETLVNSGANLKDIQIVKAMLESNTNNGQLRFVDKGKGYLGTFRQVGIGGVGVISQILEDTVFLPVNKVKYRSMLFAAGILFLFFAVVYFFSKTLTAPIRTLMSLAGQIAKGNFKVDVNPKGHDEITALTHAFKNMATGLAERDRIKDTLNKFSSKEIADAVLKGEIKLGGTRQEGTIFFSDVRSFTSLSESMAPEQVLEMLNEYMTVMVREIQRHNGNVDKFVGDAIMALWDVPIKKEDGTWNALKACLAMRQKLAEFNDARVKRGKKPILIGMGLHTGPLIAGNMGSNERMNFTVIGDTVNTASRIESITKEFGTDLLISDAVYKKLKDRLIVERVEQRVKGKSDAVIAYKVRGIIENGKEIIIETPYSSYKASHSEKAA